MASAQSAADNARKDHVLSVALEVFGRYGFRKTSMDEVARAADISRQGLYLYFASKEALFRAAVRQELDNALRDAALCLDEEGVTLDNAVIAALDAWLGRFVGSMLAPDIGKLLDNSAMQLGDMVSQASAAFDALLAQAITTATTAEDRRELGVTAEEVTEILHILGRGWKFQASSRAEFVAKMSTAVRLIFAGLAITTKEAS